MSPSDRRPSERLADALDEVVWSDASAPVDRGSGNGDRRAAEDVDEEAEPYELPDIVPATEDEPAPIAEQGHVGPAVAPDVPGAPVTATGPLMPVGPSPATGWSGRPAPVGGRSPAPLRTPGRRPRVRRVTRVLRHIDPWSTFKVGLLFSLVVYLVLLTSGVLLWQVADSTGTLDNVERWFTQFGWETFELKGGEIFHNAWIIGLFGAVGLTGGLVLLATLFNLVSDIIGGIRLTVLEEEVVERTITSNRRYVVRPGGPQGAGMPAPQDWSVDDDGTAAKTGSTPTVETTTRAVAGSGAGAPPSNWSVDDD